MHINRACTAEGDTDSAALLCSIFSAVKSRLESS